jgi:hypothetical protein
MVCAYHPDYSTIFGDHHAAILVQSGALMDLQQGFQLAYPTTILSNQFSRIFGLIQNPWICKRSCHHEKCSKLDFLTPYKFLDF